MDLQQLAKDKGRPLIVAHRGYAPDDIKKDSLEAFRFARDLGADAVEFDARITGDNQVVVKHGPFLINNRGFTQISSHPLSELKKRVVDPNTLPSFAELYGELEDLLLFVQIKNPKDADAIIHHIREIVPEDRMENLVFMGYRNTAVQNHIYPDLQWGEHYYFPTWYNLHKIRQSMKYPGFKIISPYIGYLTSRHMRKVRKMNCAIVPFSVNSTRTLKISARMEMEAIYTDNLPLAIQVLHG